METRIKQTIKDTVGIKTITITNKKKESKETKELREKKKEAKKKHEKTRIHDPANKMETLDQYFNTQKQLRNNISQEEIYKIEKKIEELTKACEKDLSEFWKTRKYLLELQNENIYQTIDEEGNITL